MNIAASQRGAVLLYSLLVIFLITAIALTVSVVIINELKLTSAAVDGTQAYYGAEAGIEKGLHAVKVMRTDSAFTLSSAVSAIQGYGATFSNAVTYSNEGSDDVTSDITNYHLPENNIVQADYYDYNSPLAPTTEVVSLLITNDGDDGESWAEVTWIAWTDQGVLSEEGSIRHIIGPTDLSGGWCINNLDLYDDINPVGYRVRVKALFGPLSNVSVTPYDAGSCPNDVSNQVSLPSQIQIKAVGTKSGFKQALTATVPWQLPIGGIYDYVLFSEGDIIKDIILGNVTYSSGVIQVEEDLSATCNVCATCMDPANGWLGDCTGTGASCTINPTSGTCQLDDGSIDYFSLPIPATVAEGDDYYVSVRMSYVNYVANNDRDVAVEISGQSSVISDPGSDGWYSCTLPDTFSIGDSTLPNTDPSRRILFSANGTWDANEAVNIDWYQLSTYKVFQECQ